MTCIYNHEHESVDDCVECGAGLCETCGYEGEHSELRYCNECYELVTNKV